MTQSQKTLSHLLSKYWTTINTGAFFVTLHKAGWIAQLLTVESISITARSTVTEKIAAVDLVLGA
jgi:hypothetical protein